MPASSLTVPAAVLAGTAFKATPTFTGEDWTLTFTLTSPDGTTLTGKTAVHENIVLSTSPAAVGNPNTFVLTVARSDGGPLPTLAVDPDGVEFDVTA